MSIYTGVNGTAKKATAIYAGVNSTARKIVRAYAGVNGVAQLVYSSGILPSGYQQVEYIEGTGTQFIDSRLTLSVNNYAIEIDFWLQSKIYSGSDGFIFGCYGGSDARLNYVIKLNSGGNKQKLQAGLGQGLTMFSGTADTSNRHTYKVDMKNLKVYYDNASISKTSSGSYSRGTNASAKIGIMCGGNSTGGWYSDCTKGKLYNCKIWQNDELIRDYYPCYRKTDNEPGLYDIITDTFLPNAGTGTFGVGGKYEQIL